MLFKENDHRFPGWYYSLAVLILAGLACSLEDGQKLSPYAEKVGNNPTPNVLIPNTGTDESKVIIIEPTIGSFRPDATATLEPLQIRVKPNMRTVGGGLKLCFDVEGNENIGNKMEFWSDSGQIAVPFEADGCVEGQVSDVNFGHGFTIYDSKTGIGLQCGNTGNNEVFACK